MSKKQEIIDAAVREFGEYSYDAASINRIIKASGTSKGTFYYYFKDKKDLYFSIIEEAVHIKQHYMAKMMEQVESTDFFEMMKAQTKAAAQLVRDMPELYHFGLMYAKEGSAIKDEISDKYIAPIGDTFQKIVETVIQQGKFTDRYPPEFVSRIIRYLMENYYYILFTNDESPAIETIGQRLDMLFDFIQRGFQP